MIVLSNIGYNGIICYPSFNNLCIEAWPQDRIEKIKKFGYSVNTSKKNELKKIVTSFQRRFRPELIDGKLDLECFQIIKSLNNL